MYLPSMRINVSKDLMIYDHFVHNDFRYIVRLSTNHNVFLAIFFLKFMNIIYYREINYLQFRFLYTCFLTLYSWLINFQNIILNLFFFK